MLHYVYTDKLTPWLTQDYVDLLRIGHKYNIQRLVNDCERALALRLDKQNIFDMLNLAERFGVEHLKDATTTFIAEHLKSLIHLPKFAQIIKPSADLLFDILRKTVREETGSGGLTRIRSHRILK
jgi:hypothetical protein